MAKAMIWYFVIDTHKLAFKVLLWSFSWISYIFWREMEEWTFFHLVRTNIWWWKGAVWGQACSGISLNTTGLPGHMEGSSAGVPGLGRGCWWRWEELWCEWGRKWWGLSSECLLSHGAGIYICCWACWVSGITSQHHWWLLHLPSLWFHILSVLLLGWIIHIWVLEEIYNIGCRHFLL